MIGIYFLASIESYSANEVKPIKKKKEDKKTCLELKNCKQSVYKFNKTAIKGRVKSPKLKFEKHPYEFKIRSSW